MKRKTVVRFWNCKKCCSLKTAKIASLAVLVSLTAFLPGSAFFGKAGAEALIGANPTATALSSFPLNRSALGEIICAGYFHTVGLKPDGTVVAAGNNDYSQCNVSTWTDIAAVAAGAWHTIGLHNDGTVLAIGYNKYNQCDVSAWTDIVAVAAGQCHTVGLRSDGTVVAVGDNSAGQCNVSSWKNIVAVAAGPWHTVGLQSDGAIVAVGADSDNHYNVDGWNTIHTESKTEAPAETGIPCTELSLVTDMDTLTFPGQFWRLMVKVAPQNTTDKVIYISGNEDVVTVDENGCVTAVGEGETVIVIICGSKITETPAVVNFTANKSESFTAPNNGSVLKLKKSDITLLKRGMYITLELENGISPESVKWSTSDSSVATVYNGNVTAIGKGICTIRAEYNGQVAECMVRCKFE